MAEVDDQTAVVVEPVTSGQTPVSIAREVLSLALFDHGATAVTQTPKGSLLAGFTGREEADAAIATIAAEHHNLIAAIEIANDADYDWATSQRGGFTPTRVGKWHIRTPWSLPPENIDPRFDIQIDPGEAFGHGAHPSTQLAVQLMDPHLQPQERVLDIGTGTGVLAIIAARAGAHVRAIDNSPAAITAAQQNISLNSTGQFSSLADRIDVCLGDGVDHDDYEASLVVANVTIDIQRLLAPRLQGAPIVIASGVLPDQVSRLRDLYPSHCANTVESIGEWSAVEFLLDPMSNQGTHRA